MTCSYTYQPSLYDIVTATALEHSNRVSQDNDMKGSDCEHTTH